MFSGSLVAIVTPFRNGKFDEQSYGELIEFQIANGTHGIVPCGTTGESATLSPQEHERVVAFTIEVVNRRLPVIAGTGSNATDEAITFTKHAKQVGADGAGLSNPCRYAGSTPRRHSRGCRTYSRYRRAAPVPPRPERRSEREWVQRDRLCEGAPPPPH